MKIKLTAIIVGTMLSVTGTTLPASAAGPHRLHYAGSNVNFPTWGFGKHTQLCVRSLDPNHWGRVRINAGVASEELGTGGGAINCIQRSWGGIYINVANNRNDLTVPVDVWTQ